MIFLGNIGSISPLAMKRHTACEPGWDQPKGQGYNGGRPMSWGKKMKGWELLFGKSKGAHLPLAAARHRRRGKVKCALPIKIIGGHRRVTMHGREFCNILSLSPIKRNHIVVKDSRALQPLIVWKEDGEAWGFEAM